MTFRTRRRLCRAAGDRGAGTLEYLGVVVLAVVLVAAVVTAVRSADLGAAVAERMNCVVRAIGTQEGACGGDDTPTYYGGDGVADSSAPGLVDPPRSGRATVPGDGQALAGPARSSDVGRTARTRSGEDDAPGYANASGDGPAADEDLVEQGLADVRDALAGGTWGVRTSQLADAKAAIEQLNGRELDGVLAQLSDEELEQWVDELDDGWVGGGWSRQERRELWEVFASKASKENLDRMAQFTDELQPGFGQVGGKEGKADKGSTANNGEYGELSHR